MKESSKRAEIENMKQVADLKTEKAALEMRLERRTREVEDLAQKISNMNSSISVMKSAEKSARLDAKELENRIVELKRESSQLEVAIETSKDRTNEVTEILHQRDVEIDAMKSIMTNKNAECEELQIQLSKQEQLVHELTTELNTKTSELRRLTLSFEETAKELDAQIEHSRIAKIAQESNEETIGRLRVEVENYEKMKPHPESEVLSLQAKIDCLVMERDSARVKGQDAERRLGELGALCAELRAKLKSQHSTSEKRARTATVYETKCLAAERRIKELENAHEAARSDDQREIERYRTQLGNRF